MSFIFTSNWFNHLCEQNTKFAFFLLYKWQRNVRSDLVYFKSFAVVSWTKFSNFGAFQWILVFLIYWFAVIKQNSVTLKVSCQNISDFSNFGWYHQSWIDFDHLNYKTTFCTKIEHIFLVSMILFEWKVGNRLKKCLS